MAYSVLSPVSVAVVAKLNVAGLTALIGDRLYDDLPQGPTYPCIWYEVQEEDVRGFGTGALPLVRLLVHVYSSTAHYEGMAQAQTIAQKVVELLKDQALTIAGYEQAGLVFHDETVPLPEEQIEGVKVRELVARFRIFARES